MSLCNYLKIKEFQELVDFGRNNSYKALIMAKTIPVGEFRQRATEYVRMVAETKESIEITRHGVAVAELRPVEARADSLLGSVTYLDADLTRPLDEDWEAKR